MLTRQHLRLKVFQVLYSYYSAEEKDLAQKEQQLHQIIAAVYDCYLFYLELFDHLLLYAQKKIELGKVKQLPSADDLSPNLKWINNPVLHQIKNSSSLKIALKKRQLNVEEDPILIKHIHSAIHNDLDFVAYMSDPSCDYEADKKIVWKVFKNVIANHNSLQQLLENNSVYIQIEDLDKIASMVIKTIKEIQPNTSLEILPMYKTEYIDFFTNLLRKTVVNSSWIEKILSEKVENWDIDRFATVDILLLKMAITEAVEFPSIPLNVTMDEYIEFAKNYSTEKSSSFVNGLLDSVLQSLEDAGKIKKLNRLQTPILS